LGGGFVASVEQEDAVLQQLDLAELVAAGLALDQVAAALRLDAVEQAVDQRDQAWLHAGNRGG